MPDFVMNGLATGSIASRLLRSGFNTNVLRMYEETEGPDIGQTKMTMNVGTLAAPQIQETLVQNAVATLRKDEWIAMDAAVLKEAQLELRVVRDLNAAGLSVNIPNGFGKTVFQYQKQSDISGATISMSGLRRAENDRPVYDLFNLPLPIIHKDVTMDLRELEASRNGNTPLDTSSVELATQKVVEELEQLTLGVSSSYTYGGGTVYGIANFPNRLTKVLTHPLAGGWTPETTRNEVVSMMQLSVDNRHKGPWRLYYSTQFMQYMLQRYSAEEAKPLVALLEELKGINGVEQADHLGGMQLLLVEQKTSVIRMVNGMPIQVVQWEEQGGMEVLFKVMTIAVPQVRGDMENRTGIVHGSATAP